jgi:hypothetical protein
MDTRIRPLPNLDSGLAYQVAASTIYPRLKEIIENISCQCSDLSAIPFQ